MFCPNCGARNAEADTTCQKCGFNLKEAAGAKFKGTMLMMNNPAAAELRRSVPPAGTPAANPGVGAPGAKPANPVPPTEAQQMRAKLKGTMIGVAPPAAALNQAQAGATPAAPPAVATPAYAQPGPGQVNAPGVGINRGGGTMIGTGIGAPGQFPVPGSFGAPAQPAATAHAATELLPASAPQVAPRSPVTQSQPPAFGGTYGGLPHQGGPVATVRSAAADPHPLAQTQVAAGANEPYHAPAPGYAEPAATRAMSQFDPPQPQRPMNTLEGTMVAAGSIPPAPRTDSMPQVSPHFGAHAGSRTDTPPMGFPAAGHNYASGSTPAAAKSKGKSILLTVMTCGLYRLFKKSK